MSTDNEHYWTTVDSNKAVLLTPRLKFREQTLGWQQILKATVTVVKTIFEILGKHGKVTQQAISEFPCASVLKRV